MDYNIQNEIKEIKRLLLSQNLLQKEFFTVAEATIYLQLSKSCLYKMTSKKEIPFYSPGGKKIYFLKTELDDWIYSCRVTSSNEVEEEVGEYIGRNYKI